MKKCISLFSLIYFLNGIIYAQDWQCIHDSIKAYYAEPVTNAIWTIKVDSIVLKNDYKYYYNFPEIRFKYYYYLYNGNYITCNDALSPSKIGTSMSAGEAGNFFFNSTGDGIRIRTDQHVNDSWICCRITDSTHLDAIITLAKIDTVLGFVDSVKYISFQAKNNNGESISHPLNNQILKISKHYGMLTLFDFYIFPNYSYMPEIHTLAGISSPGLNAGIQNLTSKEIFSYAPGDEFHTYFEPEHFEITEHETRKTIRYIIDSSWNFAGDTVKYKVARLINRMWTNNYLPVYIKDTITEVYSFDSDDCKVLDMDPDLTSTCFFPDSTAQYFESYDQFFDSKYNNRSRKNLQGIFQYGSGCGDSLVSGNWFTTNESYYIDGCGGEYYSRRSHIDQIHYNVEYNYLVYFKKGSETWGTPFDTTDWKVIGIKDNPLLSRDIILYPIPAKDQVMVELPDFSAGNYFYTITSIPGLEIERMTFETAKYSIPVSRFRSGIYMLRIFRDNKPIGMKRFIKQ